MRLSTIIVSLLVLCGVEYRIAQAGEGYCPLIIPDLVGTCDRACMNDEECEIETHKCCKNACGGTHCVEPEVEAPCTIHECQHPGEVCIDDGTHSACLCGTVCPDNYEPVCSITQEGKDPEKFSNMCYMSIKMCQLQKTLNEVKCIGMAKEEGKDTRIGGWSEGDAFGDPTNPNRAASLSATLITIFLASTLLLNYLVK